MKRILITGGPTNEYIDEVMKITNMSTGRLAINLAGLFLDNGDEVTLICTRSVARSELYHSIVHMPKLKTIQIETTQQMLSALADESTNGLAYDLIIHAAAVGDYKPEFSFKMEDMAKELNELIESNEFEYYPERREEMILNVLTNPKCKVNDDTKISSYEPNLTVKLGLTPKIISHLREWFPNAKLVGFKLLENVSKEHIIEIATKLCNKNDMDYIIANDLHDLRQGKHISYLCNKDGYCNYDFNTPQDIFEKLKEIK